MDHTCEIRTNAWGRWYLWCCGCNHDVPKPVGSEWTEWETWAAQHQQTCPGPPQPIAFENEETMSEREQAAPPQDDWEMGLLREQQPGWYWWYGVFADCDADGPVLFSVEVVDSPYGRRTILGGRVDELLPPGFFSPLSVPVFPGEPQLKALNEHLEAEGYC